ncbi:tRNA-intron lyase [Thermococci archaeon]|uniref:tRNA-intron lyase n=1 Tax=Palaeococcus sp. (in: euryarchaeotes) TaxID=2820298 RepID=UPI000F132397|nr:tRNA-intron lyase [Palaeococcus sp. (in: euryarchaeotes)]MCD6558953.1 tRNA-intron lyase [Palaeococcus sp. (in: euryarchaeotes)]RLF76051.1 MAG: tRNA-intron lyase [Thermococci archaeon]RLF89412.1 MAG: tRNA-intron lyase [Thermococci archaeon]
MKPVEFYLSGERVFSEREKAINQLYNKRYYGEIIEGKLFLSLIEAAYLMEWGKIRVFDGDRELSFRELFNMGREKDEQFDLKFLVYRDLRKRGYIVKTALKYGSHFRVYRKGMEEHADWLVWVVSESQRMYPNDLTARVRVAHGVRKNMIMAVVDEDNDVVYYKIERVKF